MTNSFSIGQSYMKREPAEFMTWIIRGEGEMYTYNPQYLYTKRIYREYICLKGICFYTKRIKDALYPTGNNIYKSKYSLLVRSRILPEYICIYNIYNNIYNYIMLYTIRYVYRLKALNVCFPAKHIFWASHRARRIQELSSSFL